MKGRAGAEGFIHSFDIFKLEDSSLMACWSVLQAPGLLIFTVADLTVKLIPLTDPYN